jgi:hypothetical protein
VSGDHRRPGGRVLIAIGDAAGLIIGVVCAVVVMAVVLAGVL